mmetsp:Transcript_63989/g.176766  ORF Transcript_63989/g.176766 Transcript_63989/m.176766 type:complete len:151 (-) Transcript_63989:22-474(-)
MQNIDRLCRGKAPAADGVGPRAARARASPPWWPPPSGGRRGAWAGGGGAARRPRIAAQWWRAANDDGPEHTPLTAHACIPPTPPPPPAGRVGKTSILLRYVRDEYNDRQQSTLQASYLDKRVSGPGNKPVQLSIWDTAGQERFHALGPIY